jgi:ferredoxin-thioredoxin reductase catalytic subunit
LTTINGDFVRRRAEADAKTYGYSLVADPDLLQALLDGLKVNEERYGYPSCPCRLASGNLEFDRDIICPCDYRDPDVAEFGACYCRLYVNRDVYKAKQDLPTVPERRPLKKQSRSYTTTIAPKETNEGTEIKEDKKEKLEIKSKLWYCRQCGYVTFRDDPPYVCPICKAKRELFAEIKTRFDFIG